MRSTEPPRHWSCSSTWSSWSPSRRRRHRCTTPSRTTNRRWHPGLHPHLLRYLVGVDELHLVRRGIRYRRRTLSHRGLRADGRRHHHGGGDRAAPSMLAIGGWSCLDTSSCVSRWWCSGCALPATIPRTVARTSAGRRVSRSCRCSGSSPSSSSPQSCSRWRSWPWSRGSWRYRSSPRTTCRRAGMPTTSLSAMGCSPSSCWVNRCWREPRHSARSPRTPSPILSCSSWPWVRCCWCSPCGGCTSSAPATICSRPVGAPSSGATVTTSSGSRRPRWEPGSPWASTSSRTTPTSR